MEQDKMETGTPSLPPLSSAAAVPQKAAPTAPTTPTPAVPQRAAAPSLAQKVNQAQGRALPLPKGLTKFNTADLTTGYFHGCVYGETSTRKTSTACQFDTPANTRIILTRRKEQLLPLRDMGYDAVVVEDATALLFALQYPEQLWPEWANLPNRTLVLDDATEAVNMLLEDNETIDGREVRDRRRAYDAAGQSLRDIMRITLRKPQNFVFTALAKVRENPITNEEEIGPDLPPSMRQMTLTEIEFAFYVKPASWKLLTERDFITYKDTDDKGQEKVYRRTIFAKSKLPLGLTGQSVVKKEEDMNLAALWKRIQAAKGAVKK